MPRRMTQFVKAGYYHVYNRGAARLSIIREERNYAYLLPNHYHWLVRQDAICR